MPKATAQDSTVSRRASNQKFYAANREREKARAHAWRVANPDRNKATTKAWRVANKERHAALQKAWAEAHKTERKVYRRLQHQATRERANELARLWKKNNAAHVCALNCRRQALRIKAVPPWADQLKIEALYHKARELTMITGIEHHVDHVVPLQSKWVCGLHCEANLQVMVGTENQSKSNHTWPDMGVR